VHWLDLTIVGFVTWTTFRAFRKGLVREIVHITALVAGVIVAGQYYDQLSANLHFILEDRTTLNVICFALLLSGVLILGQIVASTLRNTVKMLMLGPVDTFGGALFGLCKGIILVEVLLILVSIFPISGQLILAIENSKVASFLVEQSVIVEQILPSEFEEAFEKLKLNLDKFR
jgi:membrane protein required for colicin V production